MIPLREGAGSEGAGCMNMHGNVETSDTAVNDLQNRLGQCPCRVKDDSKHIATEDECKRENLLAEPLVEEHDEYDTHYNLCNSYTHGYHDTNCEIDSICSNIGSDIQSYMFYCSMVDTVFERDPVDQHTSGLYDRVRAPYLFRECCFRIVEAVCPCLEEKKEHYGDDLLLPRSLKDSKYCFITTSRFEGVRSVIGQVGSAVYEQVADKAPVDLKQLPYLDKNYGTREQCVLDLRVLWGMMNKEHGDLNTNYVGHMPGHPWFRKTYLKMDSMKGIEVFNSPQDKASVDPFLAAKMKLKPNDGWFKKAKKDAPPRELGFYDAMVEAHRKKTYLAIKPEEMYVLNLFNQVWIRRFLGYEDWDMPLRKPDQQRYLPRDYEQYKNIVIGEVQETKDKTRPILEWKRFRLPKTERLGVAHWYRPQEEAARAARAASTIQAAYRQHRGEQKKDSAASTIQAAYRQHRKAVQEATLNADLTRHEEMLLSVKRQIEDAG
eukprot:g4788.t1